MRNRSRNRIKTKLSFGTLVAVGMIALFGCGGSDSIHSKGISHSEEARIERGPHGGLLFRSGAFSTELAIFENGTPPRFRLYGYRNGSLLAPSDFSGSVTTTRLGGKSDLFELAPAGEFLSSPNVVVEPHSFKIAIVASYQGESFEWSHDSPEARTTLLPTVGRELGVKVDNAEPRTIVRSQKVRGKIFPSEHRIAHIIPRFAGVVREGRKHIGDSVAKGEVLAVIESNQTLQPFTVHSHISGTVLNGHLVVGEFVPEGQWVYIVADLSEVWADFSVRLDESSNIEAGQTIVMNTLSGQKTVQGTVSYIAPYADQRSQAKLVRAVVPNQDGSLPPGSFVTGLIRTGEKRVTVAVKKSAIQRFRDWDVVFVKYGDEYEARPIKLGASDETWVEVIEGLKAGEAYVSDNSFLIKADILKSGASHDH